MPVKEIPILLKSLDSRSNQVREIGFAPLPPGSPAKERKRRLKLLKVHKVGRALAMQNVDIEKANEVKRRKGYVRRLHEQQSGPIRMLFAYPGLCGRVMEYAFGTRFLTIVGAGIAPFFYGYPGGSGSFGPGSGILDFGIQQQNPTLAPIENFAATPGSLVLTWEYPGASSAPLAGGGGVIINRRTDVCPIGPYDPEATIVYVGEDTTFTDTRAPEGETIYYAAWGIYPSVGYAAAATLNYITRSDDFNRADGTLVSGDYTWWESTVWVPPATGCNIFNNRLTINDASGGGARTPVELYPAITLEADVWHDGLAWTVVDAYLRIYAYPSSGTVLRLYVEYDPPNNQWRLGLYGATEGSQRSAYVAGTPPLGKARLTITDSQVSATYAGITLRGTPDPTNVAPFYSLFYLLAGGAHIDKRMAWDNVLIGGETS